MQSNKYIQIYVIFSVKRSSFNNPPIVLDQIFLLGWYLRASSTCCSHVFKCNNILHKQDIIMSWVQWWDCVMSWFIFVNVCMLTLQESFWNFCAREHCKCLCKIYFWCYIYWCYCLKSLSVISESEFVYSHHNGTGTGVLWIILWKLLLFNDRYSMLYSMIPSLYSIRN